MKLYAVLGEPSNSQLEQAVIEKFAGRFYNFGDGQWFLAGSGTTAQIYKTLSGNGSDEEHDIGTVVVLSIGGYYGWAGQDLWEWMAAQDGE